MQKPVPSGRALVPFVSVENMARLITSIGLPRLLTELVDYIEQDFLRWQSFEKSPRLASHSEGGVIELMPTSDHVNYVFKYVNGHPVNLQRNLQTVVAFGVLSDVETGYPLLLTEMTLLTALRTAATSAMVARLLAPKDARVLALIGNGAQAEFQAIAMQTICGIEEVRLYDIDPAATAKTARNLAQTGLRIAECKSVEEAVLGAQIITTCTADKQNATILTDNLVGDGVHINAIGGDCPGKTELAAAILNRSDVFVEFPPQTRIEGEIQQMPEDFPVTELWQVLNGERPGRVSDRQITLFDSVGFAIEDFSAVRYIRDKIRDTDFKEDLDLLADPDDTRDLYGMMGRIAGARDEGAAR
ncbi:ornithine cyclodeaminase [Rhodobacter sp. 24-YEA-8]|uniref:ornithine cyclodeaminase n=1 Tax=Rhodobacter sp. 24-YEA-8 TaxID=1884310 RepID=UPI000896580F|nr:ornithine cyclodeaminase [Rhodobacter sp. 24-YEA-8]SED40449.1 ornithine cyclodeaminase [Rhodobacter sp. 24-YEA-8]